MSRVLEVVRDEIADLEERLVRLRDIERLALNLNGGPPELAAVEDPERAIPPGGGEAVLALKNAWEETP